MLRLLLASAIGLFPFSLASEELPTIQNALDRLDGTQIQAKGFIGRDPLIDWIQFYTPDGLRLRVELALDRQTLEAVELCEHNGWDVKDGSSVEITGAIRVKGDYFQLLIDSVANLTPLE